MGLSQGSLIPAVDLSAAPCSKRDVRRAPRPLLVVRHGWLRTRQVDAAAVQPKVRPGAAGLQTEKIAVLLHEDAVPKWGEGSEVEVTHLFVVLLARGQRHVVEGHFWFLISIFVLLNYVR
jgi:hypothetical protein